MRKLLISLFLTLVMLSALAGNAFAANPTVTITVTAKVIAITNSQDTWNIGIVGINDVVYFSATGEKDNDYSQITNTGNVSVDIEIQGTDVDGTGDLDWALASSAGSEQYCLYANSEGTPNTYDVEVKSADYENLCEDLDPDDTYDWSMEFTAPTAFDPADDGEDKSATVTLVASEHTP
jgi:hypothetical protein